MPPRKELCRNFQSGSCRYGATCRFYHPQQQPSRFGTQTGPQFSHSDQPQQMPNPFGFGVQTNTQQTGGNAFGAKQPPFKPFVNTWSRPSSTNNGGSTAASTNNGGSTAKHDVCTDSESCKRVMVDDFEKESPLWKLTCYGHRNSGPCDVIGDTSIEELRALAYDDAKQGKGMPFIIERERNTVNSKLVEFRNLTQNTNANASFITQSPFVGASPNAFVNSGPSASSFTQLNASLNSGSAGASSYTFGQPTAFMMPSNIPQTNPSPFNSGGPSEAFGGQISQQPAQNPFSFGTASNRATNTIKNPFSTPANLSQNRATNAADNQLFSNVSLSASSSIEQSSSSIATQLIKLPSEDNNVDENIWKADWKWNCGEIPEQPPPDIFIHLS